MSDVTRILSQIESGDPSAAENLLPLVYDELRRLASQLLARETPGHTLQPTALVHEAYVRLTGTTGEEISWDSRGHFFSAAAEAMRRLLVENARRKSRLSALWTASVVTGRAGNAFAAVGTWPTKGQSKTSGNVSARRRHGGSRGSSHLSGICGTGLLNRSDR